MGRQYREENLLETLAPVGLWIAAQRDGRRKWICHVQFFFPSQSRPRTLRDRRRNAETTLFQSANTKRISAITPAVNPTSSTACFKVSTATARKVWAGIIVEVK